VNAKEDAVSKIRPLSEFGPMLLDLLFVKAYRNVHVAPGPRPEQITVNGTKESAGRPLNYIFACDTCPYCAILPVVDEIQLRLPERFTGLRSEYEQRVRSKKKVYLVINQRYSAKPSVWYAFKGGLYALGAAAPRNLCHEHS
jgi:hypothetical protein